MYVVDDALFTKMGEVCEQNGMKIYDASVPPHILQEWELEVLEELIKEDMQQMKDQIKNTVSSLEKDGYLRNTLICIQNCVTNWVSNK